MINTLKEFIFIAVFTADVLFSIYFLYKFKKLPVKKVTDYLFFTSFCLLNIIKAIIIFYILRLWFDPLGLIYSPKVTYIGLEYFELFNIYKSNLLNNYIGITAFIWGLFIVLYCWRHYKKIIKIGD